MSLCRPLQSVKVWWVEFVLCNFFLYFSCFSSSGLAFGQRKTDLRELWNTFTIDIQSWSLPGRGVCKAEHSCIKMQLVFLHFAECFSTGSSASLRSDPEKGFEKGRCFANAHLTVLHMIWCPCPSFAAVLESCFSASGVLATRLGS